MHVHNDTSHAQVLQRFCYNTCTNAAARTVLVVFTCDDVRVWCGLIPSTSDFGVCCSSIALVAAQRIDVYERKIVAFCVVHLVVCTPSLVKQCRLRSMHHAAKFVGASRHCGVRLDAQSTGLRQVGCCISEVALPLQCGGPSCGAKAVQNNLTLKVLPAAVWQALHMSSKQQHCLRRAGRPWSGVTSSCA